ncbi:ABC transporter ATP-binding protein/permease [Bartonella sp. HY329]|uniref:ATP-binding cassette domain-containing protein n=1 Tax=unclassified Bartonella TaxID=2645622 RepID=UPI0021C6F7C8|nr:MULTISPECIES: ABC transporter ATP-binding protein [unclassified Bartonella]UXM95130.1 ABC transporter ATP-binding protein/permease [Bartonella sp. HY329]UXN09453.1 ABC transporter ATP-binding protein/permease [Bartonella sp. HY328]
MSNYIFLIPMIKKRLGLFLLLLTIVCMGKAALILPPIILGKIVDAITNPIGFNVAAQYIWLLLFAFAALVQVFLTPLQAVVLTKFVQMAVRDASVNWTHALLGKEFSLFNTTRLGLLIKGFERGIAAHEKLLYYVIITILPLIIQLFIMIGLVTVVGGIKILFFTLIGCVIYVIITHYIIVWRRAHIDDVNDCEDSLVGELATLFGAAKTVKLERATLSAAKPLENAFNRYVTSSVKAAFSGSFLTLNQSLSIALATGFMLLSAVLDQASTTPRMSAGDLVIVFSALTLLFTTVSQIGDAYRFADQFSSDRQYLAKLLNEPDFTRKGLENSDIVEKITSLRLNHGIISNFDGAPITIDQDLCFKCGEKVAIIGESGSGKTTLLEALAGLDTNINSRLFLNDKAISQYSDDQHLSFIRYNPQQAQFLEGNIHHAVFFGQNASHLSMAFHQLRLNHFLTDSNRHLSEGAKNISGGEARRLTLLRLLRNPGIFNLFDEPTSSLDPALAGPVWDTIFEYVGENGLIVATHDLQNLYRFDRIIVMEKGKLIVDGLIGDVMKDNYEKVIHHLGNKIG